MHTDLCDFKQPLEVILSLWSHETIEGEGGKVADCHLSVKDRGTHDVFATNCLTFGVYWCIRLCALWTKYRCIKNTRLGPPTSSGLEYSIISVQRLLHLIVPKFYRAEKEDASRFMLSSTQELLSKEKKKLDVLNKYQLVLHQQVLSTVYSTGKQTPLHVNCIPL